jgi:hypothetical protein
LIKGQECLGGNIERDRDVQQVNCALPVPTRVRLAQLISAPKDVRPSYGSMNKYLLPKVIVDAAKRSSTIFFAYLSERGQISKRISNFDAVERREDQWLRMGRHVGVRACMLRVCAMQRNQKRRVGIGVRDHDLVSES